MKAMMNISKTPWPRTGGLPWPLHHIDPISEGGANSIDNLIPMSPAAHTNAHKAYKECEAGDSRYNSPGPDPALLQQNGGIPWGFGGITIRY